MSKSMKGAETRRMDGWESVAIYSTSSFDWSIVRYE